MDHELKQRLIGAVVVTALAAIFIPMLFDDPVDTSGKTVTELSIPQAPSDSASQTAQNLPENKEQVLSKGDSELSVSEDVEVEQPAITGEARTMEGTGATQVPQPMKGIPESGNTAPPENSIEQDIGQNAEPGLDTGMVEEPGQSDNQKQPIVKPAEPVKELKPAVDAAIKKSAVSEKTKVKTVTPVEKTKAASKAQKETPRKSGSKLVRYSIQAGSFSKKENAQALVEKLRKQGLPATVVAKGNLYRVKVGPELDKKKAADMRARLDKQNIESLLITE